MSNNGEIVERSLSPAGALANTGKVWQSGYDPNSDVKRF
ncbi:hypothetical protein QFZ37_003626 [Chryseobacterium ginsenosidimutans]|nr:hypothetical protein [Chryseobacterium ginsenosidimutans]